MKTPVAVQNEDALHQKQDYPTEHGNAVNDDQGHNLMSDVAAPKTLPMHKK
jgi:hypothetical protein